MFFRFNPFSLVVKWPEFARVYITNILSFWNFKLAQLTDVRTRFSSPWGSIPAGLRILRHMCCTSACILSSKTNDFGKECLAKSSTRLVWWSIATGANQIRHLRLDNRRCKPFDYPVLDNFLITWMKQEVIYEVWWVFYPGNMFLVDLYQETLGPGVSIHAKTHFLSCSRPSFDSWCELCIVPKKNVNVFTSMWWWWLLLLSLLEK